MALTEEHQQAFIWVKSGLDDLQREAQRLAATRQVSAARAVVDAITQLHSFAHHFLLACGSASRLHHVGQSREGAEALENATRLLLTQVSSWLQQAQQQQQQAQPGALPADVLARMAGSTPPEAAAAFMAARAAALEQEVRDARAALLAAGPAVLPTPTPASSGDAVEAAASRLGAVIRRLREMETSLEFQAALAGEAAQLSGAHVQEEDGVTASGGGGSGRRYTPDNFAYGSTPYTSWLQLVCHTEVAARLRGGAMQGGGSGSGRPGECVVWGSSSGWLLFYGALTCGWRCVGYELLSCLAERSRQVAAEHGLMPHGSGASGGQGHVSASAGERSGARPGAGGHGDVGDGAFPLQRGCGGGARGGGGGAVVVHNADLLTSDVSACGLLLLTNQCWDVALTRCAAAKAAAELPDGAVVVDYTGALAPELGPPVAKVRVPVSWNAAQMLHAYLVRRPAS